MDGGLVFVRVGMVVVGKEYVGNVGEGDGEISCIKCCLQVP